MRYIINVPHDWSIDDVINSLAVPENIEDEDLDEIKELAVEAEAIAVPKILYCISNITDRDDSGLWFDGKRIDSALAVENLKNTDTVYPYICTCGREIYDWAKIISDPLFSFYADKMMIFYVGKAFQYLTGIMREKYICQSHASHMNPGSLPQWPLSQQVNLFNVLGDAKDSIGVELTDSFLMVPEKSMSGFYFESENDYKNCNICTLFSCPNNTNKNR